MPSPIEVFALDDTSVQLSWAYLPEPELTIEVGNERVTVGAGAPSWYQSKWGRSLDGTHAGPGAVTISGLEPTTTYQVRAAGELQTFTTLAPPPGRLLYRFATISDCHIGQRRLGFLGRLHDPIPRPVGLAPYAERCALAAIRSAESWGAQLIVAKGDLTEAGRADEIYKAVDVLETATVPMEVILGNHDVKGLFDTAGVLSSCGIFVSHRARARDLPGVRLVLGHSPVSTRHAGEVPPDHAEEMAKLAGGTDLPVVLAMHHPPQRWPVETHYPPSIGRRDSNRLLRGLANANKSLLILAGHTHRNRRYRVSGITVAEVGSTKDYPGQWAGYSVYEGGIRQTVFRVDEPPAIAWTEMTRRAMSGMWGWWSPGRLSDRCWTLEWPDRIEAAR